jgi:colanic acid biosynthesis glycosyl transferase WcaI
MRVSILTHYYAPEIGAPQTRLRETAARLMELGWDVRVVTCQPHYPHGVIPRGYSAVGPRHERIDGVDVFRLPTIARPNSGFFNRVIDQAAFAVASATALRHARWADVLLVESPPLFLGLTARWLSAVSRRPYVLHVADPWPDYPIELGVLRSRFAIGAARRIERWAYAGATAITTPTVGCRTFIEAQPTSHGKVTIVPNGVDMARFEDPPSQAAARADLGWEPERFTFAYVGTVGLAQGLDTLIAAASRLRSRWRDPRLPIVKIVGDGQDVGRLRDRASREAPDVVEFVDPVPKELVPTVLAAADVGLVLLRAGRLASAALPTKLVEALAAGLPLVVSADGEASDIVSNGLVGLVSPAGDSVRMAESMAQIAADADQRREMSRRAIKLVRTSYDRRVVIGTLAETLAHATRVHHPGQVV